MKLDLASLLGPFRASPPDRRSPRRSHSLEILEARIAPAGVTVASIVRAGGAAADTAAGSVVFTVTFSEAVTGVDATDFLVHTEGSAHANSVVTVTPAMGPADTYTVTVNNLHGQGDVRLDLVDDDSITGTTSGLLGGTGLKNGSFQGAVYHLLQTFPKVSSITANGPTTTNASSVSWTVTLSAPVTGVDPTDFALLKSGVSADAAVTVTGSGDTYTVTATGVSGAGTLALQLVDDGTIKDIAHGNPLQGTTPPTFTAKTDFATGRRPISVAVADVNGDGHPDLVIASVSDNTVSVLLGTGTGGFGMKTDFTTGTRPVSVAIADVNGDGRPDLLTANYPGGNQDGSVSVLLGNGSGAFAAKTDFATGSGPVLVTVADVNGDGKPDLVTANQGGPTVSVLLGNGSGAFAAKTDFATENNPYSVAVADVNGDGKPDLVTANPNYDTVSVLLGTGSGAFAAKTDFATGAVPRYVAVGDVNGDGKLDLVTANPGNNTVSVLLGDGSGAFAPKSDFTAAGNPNSVAVVDVNGDGKPDLVTANFTYGTVSVLLGDGSGAFGATSDFTAGRHPYTLAVADVNGDGKPDVVTANAGDNTASVLLGAGGVFTGDTFTLPPKVSSIVHSGSANISGHSEDWTVTFNGEVSGVGATDFAVLTTGGAKAGAIKVTPTNSASVYTVTVDGLHGSGDVQLNLVDDDTITSVAGSVPLGGSVAANGSFQGDAVHLLQTFPKVTSITANGPTDTSANSVSWTVTLNEPVTGVDPTDFMLVKGRFVHADADVIVTGSGANYTVTATGVSGAGALVLTLVDDGTIRDVANGNPLQGKTPPSFAAQDFPEMGYDPGVAVLADVNGDGHADLVTAEFNTVSVQLGDGSSGFVARTHFDTGRDAQALAVTDVNGDGLLDVVTANFRSANVSVLLGDGHGGFAPKTDFDAGPAPLALAVGDVNGDGRPDIVTVSGNNSGTVSLLLGDGNGGFVPAPSFATDIAATSVTLADVNGDDRLDVIFTNKSSLSVSVLLADGSGGFAPRTDSSLGFGASSIVVADVNGDGHPDLVAAHRSPASVGVLLGDGHGSFAGRMDFAAGSGPYSLAAGDLNGDGKLDLVIRNFPTSGGGGFSFVLGNGSGGFGSETDLNLSFGAVTAALGDVNGDGLLDVVIPQGNYSGNELLLNTAADPFTGDAFAIHGQTITLDARHPFTFFDSNHDQVTVKLSGLGTGTLHLDGDVLTGADISDIHIANNAAKSTLSIVVKKDKTTGDGRVGLGEVTLDGALLSFSGPAVDFTYGNYAGTGLHATGAVKTITAHSLLAGDIVTGGTATDKLVLNLSGALGPTGDPFLLTTPQTVSLLKAASIGAGHIDAAALTSISVTAGSLAAEVTSVGAIGSITVKGGGVSGELVAAHFGAVTMTGGGFSGSLTSLTSLATLGGTKSLTSLSVTGGDLSGDVNVSGAIGGLTVKGGSLNGDLMAKNFGAVTIAGGGFSGTLTSLFTPAVLGTTKGLTSLSITGGDLAGNVNLSAASGAITVKSGALLGNLTASSFGAVSVTGGLFGGSIFSTTPAATLGTIKALISLSVTAGNLSGLVRVAGASGPITVKGGGFSGELSAASFGAVSVTGGDFSGTLIALTAAATLGRTKALTSLTVTDGNLTGDIRLLGASGAITVKAKPLVNAGDLSGTSIVASAIASLSVGRDFISSIVLAGADLGADYSFGGGDDTFAAGTIGAVKIGRYASGAGSIIGAGFSNADGILKNGDDAIIGGVASYVASLTVSGTAAPESYFAAGLFKTAPKIAGAVVTPGSDARFLVG
jgi:hypothetical protein